MSVLTKVFGISLVGILTLGLLGCGCLLLSTPSTPHSPNPYSDLYKAKDLQYKGKYKAAIAKYEAAAKKFPRFPGETKVIHVSFPAFLKYRIAFCYVKLAETEGDVVLYSKAEAAARESYETAIVPVDQADALYLWAYILFKQERYEEAGATFAALLERLQQNEFGADFTVDALFGFGKALMGLGDAAAAHRVFAQLLELIKADNDFYNFYTVQVLYGLGNVYLELRDNATAQRVFAQVLQRIERELQEDFVAFDAESFYEETLYELGKMYLGLGDTATAQRAFAELFKHFPDSSYRAEVQRLLQQP